MDKYEIRRLQLQRLVDERAEGKKLRFAKLVDMHPATISHMLAPVGAPGKQLITETKIEQLEARLFLPTGWFDAPVLGSTEHWPFIEMTYQQYRNLDILDRYEIEQFLKMKLERFKMTP